MLVEQTWFDLASEMASDLNVNLQIIGKTDENYTIISRFNDGGPTTRRGVVPKDQIFIALWGEKRGNLIDKTDFMIGHNVEREL